MSATLEELWERVRGTPWIGELVDWLSGSPVLYLAGGALLFGAVFLLVWRFGLRRRRDSVSRQLLAEIRQLRRQGDLLGVGQRYETLGEPRRALEAYRSGGFHGEHAELLLRLGRREQAKSAARDGEVWVLYGELCREDEDFEEAGSAFERAGKLYEAARAWEAAGRPLKAARCYAAVGMEANAVELLIDQEGGAAAEALEAAIRSSLGEAKGSSMSPDMVRAVRRCAQLRLSEGDAERAYRLAVAAEQWEVAVPIARDYLEPEPAMIDVCLRAGAYLAAAELARELGDAKNEALYRGEHFERRDDHAEAARWYETAEAWSEAAEQWASAGELERAAELYARAGEYEQAAQLYAALGDEPKRNAMRDAARAHDPRTVLESEDDTRRVRPAAPRGPAPAAPPPGLVAPGLPDAAAGGERYSLHEVIGRGGMGVVYRARDRVLERTVAYKVLSADVTGAVADPAELLREARAAAQLSHPNIVQIYDAGRVGGGFFVVMEYVEGENFAVILEKRRLSVAGAIRVGRQICAALDHAHGRRLVHRDLKPSNLIWSETGKQVKLTDFGLARVFESSLGQVMTRAAGTPFYMSPEQIRGDPVDVKTDIYSFGCVLFELLCNRTPFTGGGSSIYHHLNSRPQDPRHSRQDIPTPLASIILQCLEKDPAKRPSSAAEVGRRLAALSFDAAAADDRAATDEAATDKDAPPQ